MATLSTCVLVWALSVTGEPTPGAAPTTAHPTANPAPAVSSKPVPPAAPPFRLMRLDQERRLRRYFPRMSDPAMQRVLDDPRLILYTDAEMPKAYQFWSGSLQGVHRAEYNISADNNEPYGNGNLEFPWSTPAGTHRAKNVRSFRFLLLPLGANGKTLPVVWYRKRFAGDASVGYGWTFPVGAIFGEVLTMRGPDGYGYTFEIRTRTREVGDWAVDVFRPFPTAQDLAARIKELRPDWQGQPHLMKFCGHLEGPVKMRVLTLADRQPGRRAFHQTSGIDVLPPLNDNRLVADLLLTTPFRSAVGLNWREDGQTATAAPTAQAGFNIVPVNYDAGFIAVNNTSCMRCHATVNENVDAFDGRRDWYGRIRGSDGIFSFHPFEPGSLSGNGSSNSVRLRDDLVRAGLLQPHHPRRHPRPLYHIIRGLRK
jgi:hypothetical protein